MPTAPPRHTATAKFNQHAREQERQRKAGDFHNTATWQRIRDQVRRGATRCGLCGELFKLSDSYAGKIHVDHKNGNELDNRPENLHAVHDRCHSIKTNKHDGGFGREVNRLNNE